MTLENLLAIHKLQSFEASAAGVQRLLAAAGRNLARSAPQHALFSVLISMLSGVLGLVFSYTLGSSV